MKHTAHSIAIALSLAVLAPRASAQQVCRGDRDCPSGSRCVEDPLRCDVDPADPSSGGRCESVCVPSNPPGAPTPTPSRPPVATPPTTPPGVPTAPDAHLVHLRNAAGADVQYFVFLAPAGSDKSCAASTTLPRVLWPSRTSSHGTT